MNTIKQISTAAVLCAALLSSCTIKEENILITPNTGKPVEVQFASDSISVLETKVQNNLWTGDERIGIFMVENNTTNISGGVSNREYLNPSDNSSSSVQFSSTNPICYPLATTPKVAFIAYYPYKALTDVWTYPIDVSTQTSQSAIDLMRAEAGNSGNGYDNTYGSTVNLHFYHKLSKIIINVAVGDGVTESLSGISVRIANLPYRGSLNLSAETNTVQRQATPVANIAPIAIVDGSQYEAIVIPGSTAGVKLSFTTSAATYEAAIPSPVEWQSGYKYSYTVTLTKHEADISGSVENWDDGTPYVPTTGYPDGAVVSGLYQGEIQVYYSDGTPMSATLAMPPEAILRAGTSSPNSVHFTADGRIPFDNTVNKVIKEIVLTDLNPQKTYLIGRHTSSGSLYLNIDESGELKFRAADNGYIPIGSFAEFQLINNVPGNSEAKYKQDADLDLLGESVTPNVEWIPVGIRKNTAFNGLFDGNGKSIINMYVNNRYSNNPSLIREGGLFGYIEENATLSNINITNGKIIGDYTAGGIAGYNDRGKIISCSYSGSVAGSEYVGGIVGASCGTIKACSNSGNIVGLNYVGGVAGEHSGVMADCYNTGNIILEGSEFVSVAVAGGVAAIFSGDSMTACYNKGSITANSITDEFSYCVGGTAGRVDSCIMMKACYNTGNIIIMDDSGNSLAGGVAGSLGGGHSLFSDLSTSAMTACYNTGSIFLENGYVGGVVGYKVDDHDLILLSYWLNVAGDDAIYGIGNTESNNNAMPFNESWPFWSIGNGSDDAYWKTLGYWNGGVNPVFPKLWYEP